MPKRSTSIDVDAPAADVFKLIHDSMETEYVQLVPGEVAAVKLTRRVLLTDRRKGGSDHATDASRQ